MLDMRQKFIEDDTRLVPKKKLSARYAYAHNQIVEMK